MTLRASTTSLIPGRLVAGNRGLGVRGSAVPATGTNGPGFLYNDLALPAEANKEVRGLILTRPSAGSFFAYENSAFTLIGAHAQNYFARLDANGGFDASFADPELCCDPLVNAIALQADGSVLIGGAFSQAGGVNGRFYFARFSSSGVFDPSFPAITTFPQPSALMVAPVSLG